MGVRSNTKLPPTAMHERPWRLAAILLPRFDLPEQPAVFEVITEE